MSSAGYRWDDFIPVLTWVWGMGIWESQSRTVRVESRLSPTSSLRRAEEAGGGVSHRGGEDEDRRRETESPDGEAAAGDQAETSH